MGAVHFLWSGCARRVSGVILLDQGSQQLQRMERVMRRVQWDRGWFGSPFRRYSVAMSFREVGLYGQTE